MDFTPHRLLLLSSAIASCAIGCAGFPDSPPETRVVLENHYPTSSPAPLVVYDAFWLTTSFQGDPLSPGASSDALTTIPCSENTAYVLLAPGWDPTGSEPPSSLLVLQSRTGFSVALGDTLHIPVDDADFVGNCTANSRLAQSDADFITQIVFAADFAGLHYDASTCTTTPTGDAGAP